MLRACHDLLRPGGYIAFTTIYLAPGADARQRRLAYRARGCGIASRRTIAELMTAAGFVAVRERDITSAFARTTRAFLEAADVHREALIAQWGEAAFDERRRDRTVTLESVRAGAVRRGMFVGRRRA